MNIIIKNDEIEVPFPAVTICNQNAFKEKEVREFINESIHAYISKLLFLTFSNNSIRCECFHVIKEDIIQVMYKCIQYIIYLFVI